MSVHNQVVSYIITMRHPGIHNIVLYNSNNKIVGQYLFSSKISETSCRQLSDGVGPSIQAPLSELPLILDILRNEKPLYIGGRLQQQTPYAYLSTSQEPVGEEETSVRVQPVSPKSGRSTITGHFTGEKQLAAGVHIQGLDQSGKRYTAQVDAYGRFRITNLPEGNYRVSPFGRGKAGLIVEPSYVDLRCQRNRVQNIIFEIKRISYE
jgi:hypothetical protein